MPTQQPAPHDILAESVRRARQLAEKTGIDKTRALLRDAQTDLERRIAAKEVLGSGDSFDLTRMRATLEQVRHVTTALAQGIGSTVLSEADKAAKLSGARAAAYLKSAQEAYGQSAQPLRLDDAAVMDDAVAGARASVLRRIASDPSHPGRPGVLQRYGEETIGFFEKTFRVAAATNQSVDDVRESIKKRSPFLRGAPAHWAERVARTELMAAHNAANLHGIKAANEQLGDMAKVLMCPLDGRTGADSIDVHGQVRRPDEEFDTWFGSVMAPPDRPNDRATVVPHRCSWPLPPGLRPYPRSMVLARWKDEGRKGSPPERPTVSTIDLDQELKRSQEQADEDQAEMDRAGGRLPDEEEDQGTAPAPAGPAPEDAQVVVDAFRGRQWAPMTEEDLEATTGLSGDRLRSALADAGMARRSDGAWLDSVDLEKSEPQDATPEESTAVAGAFSRLGGGDLHEEELKAATGLPGPRVRAALRAGFEQIAGSQRWRPPAPPEPTPPPAPPVAAPTDSELVASAFKRAPRGVLTQDELESVTGMRGQRLRDALAASGIERLPRRGEGPAEWGRPQPPPAPTPADHAADPLATGAPQPANKLAPHETVASLAAEMQSRKLRVADPESTDRVAREVFKDGIPSIAHLEKTWGSDDGRIGIKLDGVRVVKHPDGPAKIEFEGAIVDENGRTVGDCARTFMRHKDGTLEVHHDLFRMSARDNNLGGKAGEAMLRKSLQTYEKLGVHEVTVDAAWVGRYTWATFGYDWREEDKDEWSRRAIRDNVRDRLAECGIPLGKANKMAADAAKHPWSIASLSVDETGRQVDPKDKSAKPKLWTTTYNNGTGSETRDLPLGKAALLTGPMWSGKIDLRDKKSPSYKRCKERLGL